MPDMHDAALQWAQANSSDPRAQDVLAKAWAAKNPNDPRSAQILAKFQGDSKGPQFGSLDVYQKALPKDPELANKLAQNQSDMTLGAPAAMGAAAMGAAKPMATAIGRSVFNGAGGALRGYLEPGDSQVSKLKNAGLEGLKSLLIAGGGEAVGRGAMGAANNAMKRAVGITGAASKKAPQDVGNTLVNLGIGGTRSGMADQASNKFSDIEQKVQDLVGSIEEKVPSAQIAQKIQGQAGKHTLSSTGEPLPGHAPDVSSINDRAQQVKQLGGYSPGENPAISITPAPETPGQLSAQDLLQLKRGGDWEGFTNSGTPATSTAAEIGRTQANASREALSNLSGGQMPELMKNEQALIFADKSLHNPVMTSKNPVSLSDIGASIVGSNSAGLPGAGAGVLASKAAMLPFVQSLFARMSQKGIAPAAQTLSNPAINQTLANGPITPRE